MRLHEAGHFWSAGQEFEIPALSLPLFLILMLVSWTPVLPEDVCNGDELVYQCFHRQAALLAVDRTHSLKLQLRLSESRPSRRLLEQTST